MSAYYNEIDPYAVQWLKNLIAAGLIADGEVDNRSIEEVSPDDLKGFTQCHFFAGIGGWSLAARLAGWADDEPLWTGSCPCQPFSAAGKRGGTSDERHLWPVFFELIKECRPSAVAGEQVASKLGYGWLTGVRSDLESEGYAVGAVDLCAASVGAPHIRQRMWWVADSQGSGQQARPSNRMGVDDKSRRDQGQFESEGGASRLADPGCGSIWDRGFQLAGTEREVQEEVREQRLRPDTGDGCTSSRMADASSGGRAREESERWEEGSELDRGGSWMGDSYGKRLEERESKARLLREEGLASSRQTVELSSQWSGSYIPCSDGKARRIEPSIEPLAHGIPARVGRLRAYGNAIVPQVAAEVLKAWRGNG